MKLFNHLTVGGLAMAAALLFIASTSHAADTNAVVAIKPDLLPTCPVSGDKLGADMGKPYVFVYEGQEVKLCCSMCKADFKKDPAKYIAKIRAADKPDKK